MSYQVCTKCILDTNIPNITFNEKGICNFCQKYFKQKKTDHTKDYPALERKFLQLVKKGAKKSKYDCLCLYSGGKDSTNVLYNLVNRLKLRVLAFTLDNWFLSPQTYANIEKVTSKLQVDHIFYKPDWKLTSHLFQSGVNNFDKNKESKKMSFLVGHICWPCFVMISIFSIKLTIEKGIPNVVIGTTPGQLIQKEKNLSSKYSGILDAYQSMIKPFLSIIDKEYRKQLRLSLSNKIKGARIRVLPFYEFFRYNEEEAFRIAKEKFGWQKPQDTDSCSTNCLVNALGIVIHKKRYKINPYLIPLAYDVRAGLIKREEALKTVNSQVDDKIVQRVAEKLGIPYV